VNAKRIAEGKKPATQIWLWGHGKAPRMQPFAEVYGGRGAIISAVDLVRGVGVLLGWHRIDVPGATGYLDTNYANKGKFAIEALGAFDLVCVHVEAPDEASHEGKAAEKVRHSNVSTNTSSGRCSTPSRGTRNTACWSNPTTAPRS